MVFGNMGNTSATGVAFSRNPATGENKFYGEWLINAQGEDVVAGIRTPSPLERRDQERPEPPPGIARDRMAELYKELHDIRDKLEAHYTDMQDIEFTIQDGKLYMLQCRNGKRTGTAALNMAMDMLDEKLIDERRRPSHAWLPASSTNYCTRSSIPSPRRSAEALRQGSTGWTRRRLRRDRVHLRRGRSGGQKAGKKCISFVKRPTPRTWKACERPMVFSPPAAA